METETTLVWTESGVVLDTETAVDLNFALVVLPCDAELNDTLWDGGDLEGALVLGVLLEQSAVLESGGKLWKTRKSVTAAMWYTLLWCDERNDWL